MQNNFKSENLCAYIATASYKCGFKQFQAFFFKNEIELKQDSSQMEPKTSTISTFASLKYSGNELDNKYYALIHIRGFTMVRLTSSKARAMASKN